MAKTYNKKEKRNGGIKNFIPILIIIVLLAGLPFLLLNYQSHRSGISRSEILTGIFNRTKDKDSFSEKEDKSSHGEKINFLDARPIGQTFTDPPQISNLTVADLDNDKLLDVVVCDARNNFVSWIRQFPSGEYTETILASDLIAPAHVQVIDFDRDGDNDIMVAVLGMLFPNNDKIGSVIILENDGT
jgi:hypothetical protein